VTDLTAAGDCKLILVFVRSDSASSGDTVLPTAFTHLRRFTPLVVGAAILAGTFTVNGADKRIVLIAGKPSHPPGMHEFRAGSMLLQKALSGVKGVTVQVYTNGWPTKTVDGVVVDDNAALDNADAVLIYADGGNGHPAIQRDHMKVIDALAARGVGLGFAHYAVEVPAGPPGEAMQRWIGGYYETNFSVNPMWKPAFDTLPSHPVTRGVRPFGTHDEWYFNMRWTRDAAAMARVNAHPHVETKRRGTEGTVCLSRWTVPAHRRSQRQGRDDDVGLRSARRRPELWLHRRPHARDLG
jgi:hypothetical protein